MATMKLTGKVALVSGAGGGIGRAICLAFGEAGAALACCDIDAASAEETARLARDGGGRAVAQPAMFPFRRRPKPLRPRRTRHSGASISW
jgi:NAD(P)-dependent dehydrogenase (short-subunit alcohol dehydrogenase family)